MAVTLRPDTKLFVNRQHGGMFNIKDAAECPGRIWWVGSNVTGATDATTHGQQPNAPFATIDYAIARCTADRGDTIYVLPKHVEDLAAATIDFDRAGITCIGLGTGAARPRIDFNHVDASVDIGAHNVTLRNITFQATVSAVKIGVDVEAGKTNFTMEDCEFMVGETVGTDEFIICVDLKSANNDSVIRKNLFYTAINDAHCTAAVLLTAAAKRIIVKGNHFYGNWSTAAIDDGAAITEVLIENNTIKVKDGEPGIEFHANTTGIIRDNVIESTGINPDVAIVAANCSWFNNRCVTADGKADTIIGSGVGEVEEAPSAGQTFYCDSVNGGATGSGKSWDDAINTLDAAYNLTTTSKGDIIYVAPCHSETLTTSVTCDHIGVSIIGLGVGSFRPTFTINANIDGATVTAASNLIQGLYFNEGTAGHTSSINVAAAQCSIKDCWFDTGQHDLETITVAAGGDYLTVDGCTWVVSANGPTAAIELEAAGVDHVEIKNCYFDGGSTTNSWDTATINAGSNAVTNLRVHDNVFHLTTTQAVGCVSAASSVSTHVWDNQFSGMARETTATPKDIYASAGRTSVGSGTLSDPTTLADAVAKAEDVGDRILMLPGTYTVAAAIAFVDAQHEGVTLKAAHGLGTVEIANDTDDVETITIAANCDRVIVEDVIFTKGIANSTDSKCFINCDASYLHVRNCRFDFESRANADGINLATGTVGHVIEDCVFTDSDAAHSAIVWACSASKFVNNFFDGSAADMIAFEQLATPGDGNLIKGNTILSDGAAAAVMSWQAAPGKQAVVSNMVVGTAGDDDCCGDDEDLDEYFLNNFRDGANDGTNTAVNSSKT